MHRPSDASPTLTWVGLLQVVLREHRRAAVAGLAAGVVGAALALVLPPRWVSEAAFMPQAKQGSSALGGIAAQLGVEVASGEPAQSPHFYVELLRAPQFLRRADGRVPVVGGDSVHLHELLRIEEPDTAALHTKTGDALVRRLAVVVAPRTGVVTASLTLPDPVAAQAVLQRLLDLLDAFNVETRRSRAQAERLFTERRVEELRGALREAEDGLERFLRANRIIVPGSELAFQQQRLTREVTMRAQVYATMVQSYEQARIDEVRDTPVLTRLTGPTLPFRKRGPSVLRYAAGGIALGALAWLVWCVVGPLLAPMRAVWERARAV